MLLGYFPGFFSAEPTNRTNHTKDAAIDASGYALDETVFFPGQKMLWTETMPIDSRRSPPPNRIHISVQEHVQEEINRTMPYSGVKLNGQPCTTSNNRQTAQPAAGAARHGRRVLTS